EDRHRPLVIDIGRAARDCRLVEDDPGEAIAALGALARHGGLRRSRNATERACASSPSASPSVTAAGPRTSSERASHLSSDVRFMKSSTPTPDEKRAERAVGRTWFDPPTSSSI